MKKWMTGIVVLTILALVLPSAAVAQEPVRCADTYIVRPGDTLANVAAQFYDNPWTYPTIVFATTRAASDGDGFQIIADPNLIEPGWKLCIPDAETAMGTVDVDTLKNITYLSEWTKEGTALLVDGEYSESAAPGSATKTIVKLHERMAFGYTADGQQFAAAVLVTDPGGSGTFYDLAALTFEDGKPQHVASALLGDRVQIQSLAIEDGNVVVEMIAQGPDDPMCCPTQRTVERYALQGEELVQVSVEAEKETSDLVGVVWEWERFVGGDDSVIEVDDPSRYTLVLNADGSYQVRADCNRATGGYRLDESLLTLQPGPTTLAECEPGSLYDEFLQKLGDVRTYVRPDESDQLVLNLWADAGNMFFRPVKAAHLPEVESGLDLDVADIRLDTQGLQTAWEAVFVPEKPYDQSMPPGPAGLPAHIEVLFGVTDPAERPSGDPIVYIIPVDAYRQMWDEAGNTGVTDALDRISDRTYVTNAPGSLTVLPFEEIWGRMDLAVHIGRAVPFGQLNETSAAQSGYRFVGRWAQDANPVTNQGLTYVYQGYTNDGRYLVSFFYPVSTEVLPSIDEVPQKEIDRLTSDYKAYMAEKMELLNGLDSADFAPNLATLDALVASLEIDSMPVSGLQDKTWQWISGPAQPGSSEIITIEHPEKYQVTYTSDGTVEILADCNRASLNYELKQGGLVGGMLTAPGPMTLAECGPDSHYRGFVSSLQAAQTYRVHSGGKELSLILPAGGGELVLRAASQTTSAMPLEGTPWRLVSYRGGEGALASVLSGTEITAAFADGKLTGSAGCNGYSASYEREGQTLTIGPAATTRKMCAEPEGLMAQEQAYLAALASVTGYRVQAGRLELLDAEGEAVATFDAVQESAASEVVGVTWQWQSTQTPVEKVTVDAPERYTLELGPGGEVYVQADCNRLRGTYTLTEAHITIALTASTRAACPPGSLDDRFIKELSAAVIYFTEGEELFLDLPYDSGTMRFARSEHGLGGGDKAFEFTYDFDRDAEGWVTGFADLPVDYEDELYQLDSGHRELASGLGGNGIYVQGHNSSDDLFMFLKKRVDGLKPDTAYQVTFRIDLATNVPEGLMGIGGSPGESVYVKAGATVVEPLVAEDASGYLRMSIDKGNQAQEGKDMINLGHVAHPELAESAEGGYKIKSMDNEERAFYANTDANGSLWFIVGTDSGFEGLTALYYSRISIVLGESSER